jgi:glyoxylase-like metal-dependent hydrolase (beta-lactamase superfamily II)
MPTGTPPHPASHDQAPHAPDVRYRWTLLRAGGFKLDAGSMFGLIPRVVWSKSVPIDAHGRMDVHHNCLLLERATELPPGADAPRLILIECGTGNKLDAKMASVFALDGRWVYDALHEVDCAPADIERVLVTHLHFDHAGGLTRVPLAGESGGRHNAVPSFPNAAIHCQSREWSDAIANRSVMTRTYYRDHLDPIADRVRTIDSPRPFLSGAIVERDQDPMVPWELRTTEVNPGVRTFLVPGHTWGQQAISFVDTSGRTVVFTPDVMPTAAHLGAAYSLAYDVEPYTSMVSKRWFLCTKPRRGAGRWCSTTSPATRS